MFWNEYRLSSMYWTWLCNCSLKKTNGVRIDAVEKISHNLGWNLCHEIWACFHWAFLTYFVPLCTQKLTAFGKEMSLKKFLNLIQPSARESVIFWEVEKLPYLGRATTVLFTYLFIGLGPSSCDDVTVVAVFLLGMMHIVDVGLLYDCTEDCTILGCWGDMLR
jgi:hypothetical protein